MVVLASHGVQLIIFSPLFIFFVIFNFLVLPTRQAPPHLLTAICVYSAENYTRNATYSSNLITAFSNLSSVSSSYSFSSLTVGSHADTVYALYDCQDNLLLQTCHNCVDAAAKTLLQSCIQKEAIIYYEECMLRYANRMIFSAMEFGDPFQNFMYAFAPTLPDGGKMNKTVGNLFERLINVATSTTSDNDTWPNFAHGSTDYFTYQTIAGLVECTPDLTREQCKNCLMTAFRVTINLCAVYSRLSCRIRAPSCHMTYIVRSTFNMTYGLPPNTSPVVSPVLRNSNNGGVQRLFSIYPMLSFSHSIFLFSLLY